MSLLCTSHSEALRSTRACPRTHGYDPKVVPEPETEHGEPAKIKPRAYPDSGPYPRSACATSRGCFTWWQLGAGSTGADRDNASQCPDGGINGGAHRRLMGCCPLHGIDHSASSCDLTAGATIPASETPGTQRT